VHLTQRARVVGYTDGIELLPWIEEAIVASDRPTTTINPTTHQRIMSITATTTSAPTATRTRTGHERILAGLVVPSH